MCPLCLMFRVFQEFQSVRIHSAAWQRYLFPEILMMQSCLDIYMTLSPFMMTAAVVGSLDEMEMSPYCADVPLCMNTEISCPSFPLLTTARTALQLSPSHSESRIVSELMTVSVRPSFLHTVMPTVCFPQEWNPTSLTAPGTSDEKGS